ncbi:MAG TPA: PQQ-binding-like beta-propeller repeat protein, partial [Planctomycetaceae bacterium]|nr:PQQ-binding-like beta-propeller repeat protein [Planctomycetaceae bacterium]
ALDGADKGKELWSVEELGVGKSAPLFVDDRLYVIADNATMFVLDTKNKGAEIGKKKMGTIMTGSSVYGDGKIYAGEATGRWYIFKPSDNGVEVVQQLRLGDEILGSPIISHGRIYLPTGGGMYCIGNKDQEPSADPRPELPAESPVSADEKPVLLQIAPCETLMKPGEKVRLQARLYNAKGQFLKQAEDVQWTVDGAGNVDEHGYFHAPKGDKPAVALITAKSGDISSVQSRVRISPPLPWSFDFDDGKIPATWIGVRGRFQPRDFEGEKVLVKVTTVPKGTRSQSWMGQDDLHDYTIQADVRGALTEGKLPDIGLIDQRYTLDLMGAAQQLQIRSWTPQLELRFAKNEPYEWKPDTWYTLKFQAENKDGEAILRGKVWPRGEKEPEAWQIEAADKTPNTVGSPGLFGNAQNSEIYLDNIKVYPNSQDANSQDKGSADSQ